MDDLFSQIIAFEEGELDDNQVADFFQRLVDSGLAWQLQGMYGRLAADFIGRGICRRAA